MVISPPPSPPPSPVSTRSYRFKYEYIPNTKYPKLILIVGINPSTARSEDPNDKGDHTTNTLINLIMNHTKYNGYILVNLKPYVSKDANLVPNKLSGYYEQKNRSVIREYYNRCEDVLYMWGVYGPRGEPKWLRDIIKKDPLCFAKVDKGRKPRHIGHFTFKTKGNIELLPYR